MEIQNSYPTQTRPLSRFSNTQRPLLEPGPYRSYDFIGAEKLKQRADLHLARRIWHACGVFLIAFIYWMSTRTLSISLLSLATLVFVLPDIYRLRNPVFNQFVIKWFRPILRNTEIHQLSGVTFLILGVFLIALIFPKPIVALSLLFLAFGDPVASIVGVLYGKDKIIGQKSLQGTLASFAICTFISFVFFLSLNLMTERLVLTSLLAGLIGAIAELVPIRKIDDNFTAPVISSALLWALFLLFGGFS